MISGIYRIELGNGWFYIGSAVNLHRRKNEHERCLKRTKHRNQKMQNIWQKYSVLEFKILEQCSVDQLIVREQIYLDKYFHNPKNVNLAPKAGSPLGVIRSAETKAKLSAANKGKVLSAEHRQKISASSKGRFVSAETRAKISDTQKGRVFSDEHRAKMVAAWMIRKAQAA